MPELLKTYIPQPAGDTFAERASSFFSSLTAPVSQDSSIGFINPYEKPEVKQIVRTFFNKYYNDSRDRIFFLGINPGRFGGGITGLSFTDPVALRDYCSIENDLGFQKELSSEFIYMLIDKFGGPARFFSVFFLTALYPLAIVKDGKNYNFYDDKELYLSLKPDMADSLDKQVRFGANRSLAICLGRKNEKYLNALNHELKYFEKIITLDHPRYIMQYKRKLLGKYLDNYVKILSEYSQI